MRFLAQQCRHNEKHRHLLLPTVHNHGFVVEEGDSSFLEKDKSLAWTSKGKAHVPRWKDNNLHLHFWPQSVVQAYYCMGPQCPHYQCLFSRLLDSLEDWVNSGSSSMQVMLYSPKRDHDNQFLKVWNVLSIGLKHLIDWDLVDSKIDSDNAGEVDNNLSNRTPRKGGSPSRKQVVESSTNKKMEHQPTTNFVDYGFASTGNCSTCYGSPSGHACPRCLAGMDCSEVKVFFWRNYFSCKGNESCPRV